MNHLNLVLSIRSKLTLIERLWLKLSREPQGDLIRLQIPWNSILTSRSPNLLSEYALCNGARISIASTYIPGLKIFLSRTWKKAPILLTAKAFFQNKLYFSFSYDSYSISIPWDLSPIPRYLGFFKLYIGTLWRPLVQTVFCIPMKSGRGSNEMKSLRIWSTLFILVFELYSRILFFLIFIISRNIGRIRSSVVVSRFCEAQFVLENWTASYTQPDWPADHGFTSSDFFDSDLFWRFRATRFRIYWIWDYELIFSCVKYPFHFPKSSCDKTFY